MRKIKLKKRKKHKKLNILVITIFLSIILSIMMVILMDKKITPILLRYATSETKRFSTILINQSIDKDVLEKLDSELFVVSKDSKNEIQMVDFNTKKVNEVLEFVTQKISDNLKKLESGEIKDLDFVDSFKGVSYKDLKKGIVCEVPAGVLFSSSLLSNMGPMIPVKMSFIGQVLTNLKTKVKNYGINNVYLELSIHVEVTQKITMPISTKEVPVMVDIPLTVKMIQGQVPTYVAGNIGSSNLFSLPIEE